MGSEISLITVVIFHVCLYLTITASIIVPYLCLIKYYLGSNSDDKTRMVRVYSVFREMLMVYDHDSV